MQEWKLEIIKELDKQSEELKEIRFYDVARKMGYNHIKVGDVRDIATYFLKEHPTYKAVRFVKDPKKISSTESLFTTLVLTECEYQTEEELLEEISFSGNAATRAKRKYRDKTYDRMELSLPKGLKDEIADRVKAGKASSNTAYVVEAIREKMDREQG